MTDPACLLFLPGLLIWLVITLLPWRPWSVRETLDSRIEAADPEVDLSAITVLIPARNEAEHIGQTLRALQQGKGLQVVLVDDQSTDNTGGAARASGLQNLRILPGSAPPAGWSGKLWALEQGRRRIDTRYILLLDADIRLRAGIIAALLQKAGADDLKMVSLMAQLKMTAALEKLLLPAFIFFFKLVYPFHLSNRPRSRMAAAAGGCILLERRALERLGGFACIKQALIDDCALAKKLKQQGHAIWTGLTHSAVSLRDYRNLANIWHMVQRTAYTQLAHSPWWLLLCVVLLIAAFILPVIALMQNNPAMRLLGLATLSLQTGCYLPTLRYYGLHPALALSLPLAGLLYLLMTLHSALQHHFGKGACWKGRYY